MTPPLFVLLLVPVFAALTTLIVTGRLLPWLRRKALDRPNARSSHVVPTPRGGGLGVLAGLLPGWAILSLWSPPALLPELAALLTATLGLAWLSFRDDRKPLPAWVRFSVQIAAIGFILAAQDPDRLVFQGALPLVLDRIITGIGWLWFVNLFNFMDGIDGISAIEAGAIGLGVALIMALAFFRFDLTAFGLVYAATAAAFLWWNWHPAKVFLGDVGSVPLGLLGGWLLLQLALAGALSAALTIPLYYLADATVTLLWRAYDGEKIWQAHRRHFYQKAVQRGFSHSAVSLRIAGLNALLVALATASLNPTLNFGWLGLALGLIAVALTARIFTQGRRAA